MAKAIIRRHKRKNGQRIHPSDWDAIKTQYYTGTSLRTLSKVCNIPLGTLQRKCTEEKWTEQRIKSQQLAKCTDTASGKSSEMATKTLVERGENHVLNIAQIVEKATTYAKSRSGSHILAKIAQISELDKVGRRAFGLENSDKTSQVNIQLNVNALRPPIFENNQ